MARTPAIHRRLPAGAVFGLALLAITITACTAETPAPAPTRTATAPATPSTPATPSAPALVPEGSAEENLPLFAQIVAEVWAGAEPTAGRAYVDALAAAGFDRSAMQLTPDESTVGNPAESIQFSVRWGQECLVGQVGPATGEPVTAVLPGLADGGCLVGRTRPIDW